MALSAALSTFFFTVSIIIPACVAIQYQTSYSRPITLGAGGVYNEIKPLTFPPGHIGIRSFFGELVDDFGNSAPLTDLYLHRWIVMKLQVANVADSTSQQEVTSDKFDSLHMPRGAFESSSAHTAAANEASSIKLDPIAGMCESEALEHWFGIGSETRHTPLSFPAPYAIRFSFRVSRRVFRAMVGPDSRGRRSRNGQPSPVSRVQLRRI